MEKRRKEGSAEAAGLHAMLNCHEKREATLNESCDALTLLPLFKDKVWGGKRLASHLGKILPSENPVGESWELADQPEGRTCFADTPFCGMTLTEVANSIGPSFLGQGCWDPFPLLYKFIDASSDLSVQVHPDDELAMELEGASRGKTECWVILDAPKDAFLYIGLADGVSTADFLEALKSGNCETALGRLRVRTGDVVPIRAGTIHAITKGVLLAELQQSSDVTYRLYDWERMGLDGKPRDLHLDKGIRCIKATHSRHILTPCSHPQTGPVRRLSALCEHFALEQIENMQEPVTLTTKPNPQSKNSDRFEVVSTIEGCATFVSETGKRELPLGTTLFLPANTGIYQLEAKNGNCKLLRFYLSPGGPQSVLADFELTALDPQAQEVCF